MVETDVKEKFDLFPLREFLRLLINNFFCWRLRHVRKKMALLGSGMLHNHLHICIPRFLNGQLRRLRQRNWPYSKRHSKRKEFQMTAFQEPLEKGWLRTVLNDVR